MAALNFPSSPTPNQVYTSGGKSWYWNGSTWKTQTTSNSAGFATTSSYSYQSGYAITSGFATTATYAYQSGYGITAGTATTANYSYQSGYGLTSGLATTATYAYQSGYGITSGFATTATNAYQSGYAITSGSATTASNLSVANALTNSAHTLLFSSPSTGSGVAVSSNTTLSYNPSTNILSTSGLAITSTTASTSTSNGALTVAGGVGISGRLTFNQASFGTTGISTNPTMAMIGFTGDPIYMSVLEDNSISFEGSQGQLFSITPNLSTGYIYSVNDITGIPLLRANANANVTANEYAGNFGIGITNPGYKLHVVGSVGLTSTTASTSTTTGTLVVSGGVGIGGSLNVASATAISGVTINNGVITGNLTGTATTSGFATTSSYSNQAGYAITAGSATTATYAYQSGYGLTSGFATTASYAYQAGYGVTAGSATTATTATTALTTNAVNIASAGSSNLAHSLLFTPNSSTSGSAVSSDSAISYNSSTKILSVSGLAVTSSTASTSYNSGALVVSGGVGIGGTVNILGDETVNGRLYYSQSTVGTAASSVIPSIMFVGQNNNPITLSVLSDNTLSFEGSSGQLFSINNNLSSGTIFSVNDISGIPILRANANGTLSMGEFTGTVGVGLSNPSFKFQVSGSAGFSGTVYITGNTSIASTTASTSTTSGALIISGGVGIGGSLNVNSASSISSVILNSGTVYGNLTGIATTASYSYQSGYGITAGLATTANTSYSVSVNAASTNASHYLIFSPNASGSGIALSTEPSFVYNPSTDVLSVSGLAVTSSLGSTSTSNGALVVTNGVGIGGSLYSGSIFTAGRLQNQSFSGATIGSTDGRMGNYSAISGHDRISFGNGLFVTNSSWGAYNSAYSTDGANWISSSLPVNQGYPVNMYGNGYFVLVATGATNVLYTTNGSSWSQASIGNTLSRISGAYGNGKYVVVGSGLSYNYSTNITSWSTGTLPLEGDWRIAYGNGMFVAIAYGTNQLIYSYDGINWNIGNTNSTNRNFMKITYTNGKFMVTAWSGGGTWYSYDGINWNSTSNPGGDVFNVAYGNGAYFTSDSLKYTYSSDGFNWSSYVNFSAGYESFQSAYGLNKFITGGRIIDGPTNTVTIDPKFTGEINNVRIGAITPASGDFTNLSSTGSANLVGTVNANNLNVLSKINQTPVLGGFAGTDGWTSANIMGGSSRGLAFGNGIFVSTRIASNIANSSSDGKRWKSTSLPFSGDWKSVAWGKDKFVAVAGVGTSGAYSGNGISWTSMNMPVNVEGWYSVTYGDDKFVAVGNTSTAAYSSDGITWSGSSIANTNWTGIAYGNGTFVTVAGYGASSAYSYDGINWNLANLPTTGGGIKFITYGNGYFIVTNYVSTSINYSRDGINWFTSTRSSNSSIHTGLAYGNGVYNALNYAEVSFSYDAINWINSNNIQFNDWLSVAYGNGKFVGASSYDGNVSYNDGPSNTLNLYPKFTGDIDNVRIGAKLPAAAEFTNLAAQQPVRFTSNTTSLSTTTGALVVVGGVGIGGSIFSSSSYANSLSGVVLNNGSVSLSGTYTQSNSSTTVFTVKDGSNNTKFNIDTIGGIVSVSSSTASTSSSTGALIVSGGVGIGGTLFSSSSYANSLSGVVLRNGVITSGSWAGSLITGLYGGTGYSSYNQGDILVGAGSTFIKVGSGSTNYILSSNSIYPSGIGWTWVSAVGIGTVPPTTNHDSDLWWNAFDGTLNFYYNDGDSSQWVEISGGSGVDLTQPVHITSTVGATNVYTGALIVDGGVGIAGTLHASALVINGTYDVISQNITLASAGGTQVIHSLDASLFRSAKYMLQISHGTDYEVQEVLLLQDDTDAFLTQYAQLLSTNNLVLATYDADLSGGSMRLLASPVYSSTTFKMYCTAMRK